MSFTLIKNRMRQASANLDICREAEKLNLNEPKTFHMFLSELGFYNSETDTRTYKNVKLPDVIVYVSQEKHICVYVLGEVIEEIGINNHNRQEWDRAEAVKPFTSLLDGSFLDFEEGFNIIIKALRKGWKMRTSI